MVKFSIHFIWVVILLPNPLISQFQYDSLKVSRQTAIFIESVSDVNYYAHLGINTGQFDLDFKDDSLFKALPSEDLIYLSNHPNPYLRCYAFKYYGEKVPPSVSLTLLKSHYLDTTLISEGTYCLTDITPVFDVMYNTFKTFAFEKDTIFFKYFFTLDSFVLKNIRWPSNSISSAISNVGNKVSFYEDIKYFAEKNLFYAIVGLARYRKEEDIDLILNCHTDFPLFTQNESDIFKPNCANTILMAAEVFPHKKFEEILSTLTDSFLLKESYSSIIFTNLVNSIAAQRSDFAKIQLLKLYQYAENNFQTKVNYEKCNIYQLASAVNKYLYPEYESLILNIAREYNIFDNNFIYYYKDKNPKLIDSLCLRYIENELKGDNKSNDSLTIVENCNPIDSDIDSIYLWIVERNLLYNDKIHNSVKLKSHFILKHNINLFLIQTGRIKNYFQLLDDINKDLKNGMEILDVWGIYRKSTPLFKGELKNYLIKKGFEVTPFFDFW